MMSMPDKNTVFIPFSGMPEYVDEYGSSKYRLIYNNVKTWADARVGARDKFMYSVFCGVNVYEGSTGA